jgi:hypothetical protein
MISSHELLRTLEVSRGTSRYLDGRELLEKPKMHGWFGFLFAVD